MEIVTLGIDLAKNIFALHGVGADGKVVLQRPAVKRAKLLELTGSLPPCLIGMEACSGTIRRELAQLLEDLPGHCNSRLVKRLCHASAVPSDIVTGNSVIVTTDSDKPRISVTTISERPVTTSESPVTLFRNQRSRCVGIRTMWIEKPLLA